MIVVPDAQQVAAVAVQGAKVLDGFPLDASRVVARDVVV
jgi:hypothetical protein